MNKKYRLEIPDQYKKVVMTGLLEMNGHVIDPTEECLQSIPKGWLTPIEEGPVSSAEMASTKFEKFYNLPLSRDDMVRFTLKELTAFTKACEQNDRKRTQPLIDWCIKWVKEGYMGRNHPEVISILKTLEEK